MSMSSLKNYPSTIATEQGVRSRPDEVRNNAGGFVFSLSDLDAFRRFLILGTEGGTYYASEKNHTFQAVDSMKRAFAADGIAAVDAIVEISVGGRAPSNEQAIFALAYGASVDDDRVRQYALSKLNDVCRTGTHLFQFAEFVEKFRGWGRGLRNAVGNWYLDKDAESLGYQVTKYRQREGWSHRDLLRLSHPKSTSERQSQVLGFAVEQDIKSLKAKDFDVAAIEGFIKLQKAKSVDKVVKLIGEYRSITHDMIPTEFKGDPRVWHALLEKRMPMTALIRNLGVMTANGTLKPFGSDVNLIVEQLSDETAIRNARVHPLQILVAIRTYASGGGWRGNNGWTAIPAITSALDDAFYLAFDNVEPAGKNTLIGLDVSGSMCIEFGNSPLTCRDATAALSMVTVRSEPSTHVIGFTGGGYSGSRTQNVSDVSVLQFGKRESLATAIRRVSGLPFGATDCSLPMLYAMHNDLEVDTFVVMTDNETWAGKVKPYQALKQYRKASGRDAKLVVVGMTASRFTIADPKDRGMLDVVGFDTATPNLISSFSRGDF